MEKGSPTPVRGQARHYSVGSFDALAPHQLHLSLVSADFEALLWFALPLSCLVETVEGVFVGVGAAESRPGEVLRPGSDAGRSG